MILPEVILAVPELGALIGKLFGRQAIVEIRIQSGKCRIVRGTLRSGMITDVGEIIAEARVSSGAIWVTKSRRVHLTSSIPSKFHQRLRNVLLNG